MIEICFCGWSGQVEDKEPAYLGDGRWGLACPGCGQTDDLTWLPDEAAWPTLAEACWRNEQRALDRVPVGQPLAATRH